MQNQIPKNWQKVKLGSVASFSTGKLDSNAAVQSGKYPFFTCSQETYKTNTYSFDTECVLLGGNNANGIYPLKYYKGKFDAYQRTYVIESLNNFVLLNRFLYYVLHQKLDFFRILSTGATTKFLTLSILQNIEIRLPDVSTQGKITSILSAYDDLIENNNKQIKILEEMAQAIYKEWFMNFNYPGATGKMINSELGEIPEGWIIDNIGNKFCIILGGTPSRNNSNYWENGSIPWINSGKINEFRITSPSEYITEDGLKHSSAKLMPKRTTVIAITGATLGQVSLLEIECSANQSVVGIYDNLSQGLFNEYIYLFMSNNIHSIINKAGGGAQQHINKEIVEETKILVPSLSIMKSLKDTIWPTFDLLANLIVKNELLQKTRDLLLPKLMRGEIRV